jgi:hypothetical protein
MPKSKPTPLPAHWVVSTEIQINGRHIVPGTELKIRGRRGRFRFIKHVKTDTTEWIDAWGGGKGAEQWSSFHPDRVHRVHVKMQTPANLLKKRLEDKNEGKTLPK